MNWKIERRQLNTITEYPHNPRVITKKGLADLKRSIDKFGLAEPLVINTDGILIGGHARYQVLKSQGVTEVDAYVPERELSEEEYRELNIRLNRNIAGEFNFDILANEFDLPDLIEWGFELTDFDLPKPEIEEDAVPEVREEPVSQLGDLYILGKHRLLCGDSTKAGDVKRLMDGQKADMVFTDPPFPNNSGILEDMIIGIEDAFVNARKYCNGDMYWFWDNIGEPPFNERVVARHIWHKTNGWQTNHWEAISVFDNTNNRRECLVYSEANVGGENTRGKQGNHPTPKPISLCSKFIEKGNIILDLFGGSGSTLIACEQLDRSCYMMEIDPRYIDVIITRWETLTGLKAVKANAT